MGDSHFEDWEEGFYNDSLRTQLRLKYKGDKTVQISYILFGPQLEIELLQIAQENEIPIICKIIGI